MHVLCPVARPSWIWDEKEGKEQRKQEWDGKDRRQQTSKRTTTQNIQICNNLNINAILVQLFE